MKLTIAYLAIFGLPWCLVTALAIPPGDSFNSLAAAAIGWGALLVLFIGFVLPPLHSAMLRVRKAS